MKKTILLVLITLIASCSSSQTKKENVEYKKEVRKEAKQLYKRKYRKWNCQRLESMNTRTRGRLERLAEKENSKIDIERKKMLDATLYAIEMAMDTCEDDPALMEKEKKGFSINNENNININNN